MSQMDKVTEYIDNFQNLSSKLWDVKQEIKELISPFNDYYINGDIYDIHIDDDNIVIVCDHHIAGEGTYEVIIPKYFFEMDKDAALARFEAEQMAKEQARRERDIKWLYEQDLIEFNRLKNKLGIKVIDSPVTD